MSRKARAGAEYTLRSLGDLMGERRRAAESDSGSVAGERSLLAGPGAGSAGAELERAARRRFQQGETPAFVYVAAAFSALGGFLLGYDTGVVSGALLPLRRRLRLSPLWQELLVSGAAGAAAASALAGGALNGALGRRAAVLLASALCAAGSVLLAAAGDKEVLLAGRLVVGLGIGECSARGERVGGAAPASSPPTLCSCCSERGKLSPTGWHHPDGRASPAFQQIPLGS